MGAPEGVRQIGTAYVVSVTPDVCLTPMGATAVPVPYPIIGKFDDAVLLAMTVRMCGKPTFTTSSQVSRVQGNEAGTGGGVVSGVNRSICESVTASTTVRAEGNFVLRDGDVLKMNKGNTLGKVVYKLGVGTMIQGSPPDHSSDPAWKKVGRGLWHAIKPHKLAEFIDDDGNVKPAPPILDQLRALVPFHSIAEIDDDGHVKIPTMEDDPEYQEGGGWQYLGGLLGFGGKVVMAHGLSKASAADFAEREAAATTTQWEPAPDAATTTRFEPAKPSEAANTAEIEKSERSTAEMEAVDPNSTAKMAATDGVKVTGESPPPKQAGKYADQTFEMVDGAKQYDELHQVKIYNAAELAERRVVAGPNGELMYAESRLPVKDGHYLYVMDKNGNIYLGKGARGEVHHSSLAGGENPAGAGQTDVANGKPAIIDEQTGHFKENQPPGRSEVVKQEMSNQGVDVSGAQTQPWKG